MARNEKKMLIKKGGNKDLIFTLIKSKNQPLTIEMTNTQYQVAPSHLAL